MSSQVTVDTCQNVQLDTKRRLHRHVNSESYSEMSLSDRAPSRSRSRSRSRSGGYSRSGSQSSQKVLLNGASLFSTKKGKKRDLREKLKAEKEKVKTTTESVKSLQAKNRLLETELSYLRDELNNLKMAYNDNFISNSVETSKKRKITVSSTATATNSPPAVIPPTSSIESSDSPQSPEPIDIDNADDVFPPRLKEVSDRPLSLTETIKQQQQQLHHQLQQQSILQRQVQQKHTSFPPLIPTKGGPFNKTIIPERIQRTDTSFEQIVNRPRPERNTSQSAQNVPSAPATAYSTENVKSRTPPPIVAYDLDTKKGSQEFAKILGHTDFDINIKNSRCSQIKTRNRKDYDLIVSAVANMNIEHHRYTPYEDRVINVVLRGVCTTFDVNDISDGIDNLNLDITLHNVQKYETEKSMRDGVDLRMWLIQLKAGSNVSELLRQKRFLCHNNVTFERRKQNDVMQCKNCQHFGHIARNCSRHFRCVKCCDSHSPGECPTDHLPRTDSNRRTPSCVNCGQDHPANYRGCQAHIALIKAKQARKQEIRERQHFQQRSANTYRSPNVSFAQAVRTSKPNQPTQIPQSDTNNTNEENCLSFIQRECNATFKTDFFALQRQIRNFAPSYRNLCGEAKQQALIEFVLSITPI